MTGLRPLFTVGGRRYRTHLRSRSHSARRYSQWVDQAVGSNVGVVALVVFFVFFGATSQRITGMGFALVAAPFLVILLGPIGGVLIANLCGALSSSLILTRVWKQVEWRKVALLIPTAFLGIATGILVSKVVPSAWLEISVGLIVFVSLSASLLVRSRRQIDGPVLLGSAGYASGFMSYTAGVGGPAVSIYAVLSNWQQIKFAATVQPYFFVTGMTSLLGKVFFIDGSVPNLSWWLWLAIGAALFSGVAAGDIASKHVKPSHARAALITVAYIGSVLTIVKGLVTLINQ